MENQPEPYATRRWAALIYISCVCGIVVPFFHIVVPIFLWLMKRKKSEFIDKTGIQVINFQITFTLVVLLLYGLTILLVHYLNFEPYVKVMFFIAGILIIGNIVLMAKGILQAREGKVYKIPFKWNILRKGIY